MNNFLLDKEFLSELDKQNNKKIWAKIISLNFDELPREEITGEITQGGSINVDGTSAVRRTCSFSMISKNIKIDDYYWGLNTKFKLFIGITNSINSNYPEICWFPQGIYLISSFSTSQGINNCTISIQGKDKMCLLNGEVSGSLTAPIDFGKIEETDANGVTTISSIPIKDIITEAVHEYAKEPWQNIIVNDLDELGVELMEYKGSKPVYLFIDETSGEATQMILNENFEVTIYGTTNKKLIHQLNFKPLITFMESSQYDYINYDGKKYSVAKIEYGQTAGYRLTDLTYAGDLIANVGDSLTSILDKIVQMLGDFEYFYDLDGRFIFQRKKTYLSQSWNNLTKIDGETTINIDATPFSYEFINNDLITSISNNPNLTSLKNDFSIWGVRKSEAGAEIPIHLRYAIDHKPFYYKSINNKIYTTDELKKPKDGEIYDWREIIYQMAKDYRKYNHNDKFLSAVRDNNILDGKYLYPNGYTGYEPYYIDMEGFWRQLYNPDYEIDNPSLGGDGPIETEIEINDSGTFDKDINNIYVYPISLVTDINKKDEEGNKIYTPENSYILFDYTDKEGIVHHCINPFMNDLICFPKEKIEIIKNDNTITIDKTKTTKMKYYIFYATSPNTATEVSQEVAEGTYPRTLLYIKNPDYSEGSDKEEYIRWVDYLFMKEGDIQTSTEEQDILGSNTKKISWKLGYFKNEESVALSTASVNNSNVKNYYGFFGSDNKLKYYNKYFEKLIIDFSPNAKRYYFEFDEIKYYYIDYNYYGDGKLKYWNKNVQDSPESLNFWFDFLNPSDEMNKYATSVIGNRTKTLNDSNIKSIYFRETPSIIYFNKNDKHTERKSGYSYIQIPDSMLSLFNISSQGKSVWNVLDECLYNDTYCIESVSINTIPIYYLQPNTRICIRNDNSKIEGEYIVSRFTLPLSYNGTMSISATKVAGS